MHFKRASVAAVAGFGSAINAAALEKRAVESDVVVVKHYIPAEFTSTAYSTETHTVTACGPGVTDCPASESASGVLTSVVVANVTVCPLTLTSLETSGTPVAGSAPITTITHTASSTVTLSYAPTESEGSSLAGGISTAPGLPDVTPISSSGVVSGSASSGDSTTHIASTITSRVTSFVTVPAADSTVQVTASFAESAPVGESAPVTQPAATTSFFSTNLVGGVGATGTGNLGPSVNGTIATQSPSAPVFTGAASAQGIQMAGLLAAAAAFLV